MKGIMAFWERSRALRRVPPAGSTGGTASDFV
jgi:hypothetical protein